MHLNQREVIMPIKIKTDLEFGDVWYLKNDPYQSEYLLIGVVIRPGAVLFLLDFLGEQIEVYDFECSKERDELKVIKSSSEE